jgi:hypothetical protein
MFDLHLDTWCAIFDGVLEFNKPAARLNWSRCKLRVMVSKYAFTVSWRMWSRAIQARTNVSAARSPARTRSPVRKSANRKTSW